MPRQSSLAKIQSQIRQLTVRAERLERTASKGIRAAAKVIQKHRLSMRDLQVAFDQSASRGRSRRGMKPGTKVAPKYRDSDGNTWTGRGRSPLWLVAAEKAGKKRESFLINPPKAEKPAKPRKKIG